MTDEPNTAEVMGALLPCPFCGSEARWVDDTGQFDEPFGLVTDHAETCFLSGRMMAEWEHIIAAWNTRLASRPDDRPTSVGEERSDADLLRLIAKDHARLAPNAYHSAETLNQIADRLAAAPAMPVGGDREGGQDRKFAFRDGRFVNRVSGEAIPLDEPVMIFRARDHHALPVLREYLTMATDEHHRAAIRERMTEFAAYARDHADRMKEPGITHDIALRPTSATEGEA